MKSIATGLLVFSTIALARAQPPSVEPPSFRTASSELVVLPVTVTDKDGGYISDIARDRFAVLDDGRPQPLALFTNEDIPVTIGLVIDNSGSVGPKLGEIVAASLAFARASNPNDELFALAFNDEVTSAIPRERILARDFESLERALSALKPQGRTAMYDALLAGLDRVERGTRLRRILVLLSDGGDNASHGTLKQVLARARASDVTVYAIGLFDRNDPDANLDALKSIARATGGRRFLPGSAGLLLADCERIAREIRSGYTIGYEPPDRDGQYHRVRVVIDRGSLPPLTIRTRPGYFAAAPPTP